MPASQPFIDTVPRRALASVRCCWFCSALLHSALALLASQRDMTDAPPRPPRPSASILVFGDSLTEGYVKVPGRMFPDFHAYSVKLQELLEARWPFANITIHNKGVSGDSAFNMLTRLKMALMDVPPPSFDLAIVLAGTNDLWKDSVSEADITAAIVRLHEAVLAHPNTHSVVVSMPPFMYGLDEHRPMFDPRRPNINDALRRWSDEHAERTSFFDLASAIPHDEQHRHLWSDGIHYSHEGYDRIAELLFDFVAPKLARVLDPHAEQQ